MDKRIIFRRIGVGLVVCVLIFGITSCSEQKEAKVQMERDQIIINKLQHAERYFGMHPVFEKAFAFLRQDGLAELLRLQYDDYAHALGPAYHALKTSDHVSRYRRDIVGQLQTWQFDAGWLEETADD